MEPAEGSVDRTLSRAIVVWSGFEVLSHPSGVGSRGRLVEEFGETAAGQLLPMVEAIVEAYDRSDAWKTAPDLVPMGEASAREFLASHPEVSAEAVEALAWRYTFGHR